MNSSHIISVIIGSIIGLAVSPILFPAPHTDPMMHGDAPMAMEHTTGATPMAHQHAQLQVNTAKPIPSVAIEVLKDTKDGYNLHVFTKNFTFTPENVNAKPVDNEGHAHLFINDKKIGRLYSDWVHIPGALLTEGKNTISVTLNANDHSELISGDEHIEAITNVSK
ncbi:MAG: hypothetical protein WAX38_02540 [Minisyncoccia bacterium]